MLKYTILSFIAYFSFINTYVLEAQSAQNSINAPGTFNFNTVSSVDGNKTREEYDSDGDGTAEYIVTYTYDANGNQTRQEYDNDGDGIQEDYSMKYPFEIALLYPPEEKAKLSNPNTMTIFPKNITDELVKVAIGNKQDGQANLFFVDSHVKTDYLSSADHTVS